jgi:Family of unknown function (DUF6524)
MATNDVTAASSGKKSAREFTFVGFILRLLFALALVLATYNPAGFSAYHWIRDAISAGAVGAPHFLVGVLLLIGWSILWIATWQALNTFGVVLAALALGAVVWLLVDLEVLAADSSSAITWISLVCIATLLAIGLSWAHIWRRLTGQVEMAESD